MRNTTEKYNMSAKEYYLVCSNYNPTAKRTVSDYDTISNSKILSLWFSRAFNILFNPLYRDC